MSPLVTTSEQLTAEQTFDFAACIPRGALLRHECALEQGRAGIQLHLHRAGAALAQAKELHDELESFYVPNMDFAKWQTILDRTLESLKKQGERDTCPFALLFTPTPDRCSRR